MSQKEDFESLPPPLNGEELVRRALGKLTDAQAQELFGIGILELYVQRRRAGSDD